MENKTEKDIIIFAAVDDEVIKEIESIANEHSKSLVRLDDKVLTDYLKQREQEEKQPETVEDFISNEKNIAEVRARAISMWNILSRGADVETAKKRVFNKSDIVHSTNLSNSKAEQILSLFKAFGFIDLNRTKFTFVFDDSVRKDIAIKGLMDVLSSTKIAVDRCINIFTGEERDNVLSNTVLLLDKLKESLK